MTLFAYTLCFSSFLEPVSCSAGEYNCNRWYTPCSDGGNKEWTTERAVDKNRTLLLLVLNDTILLLVIQADSFLGCNRHVETWQLISAKIADMLLECCRLVGILRFCLSPGASSSANGKPRASAQTRRQMGGPAGQWECCHGPWKVVPCETDALFGGGHWRNTALATWFHSMMRASTLRINTQWNPLERKPIVE